MRVNLRRRDVGMPQHRLHGSQVGPPLQQVRGEGMSQHMRRRNPGDAGPVRTRAEQFPESLPRERRATTAHEHKS